MNLDHLLSKRSMQLRDSIREFTKKEIMPYTKELEADYTFVETVLKKLVDMDVQAARYPEEYGGGGVSITALAIICEELAKGDAGISLVAGINAGLILEPAIAAENKTIMDRFIPDFCGDNLCYACLSMTDEKGGADTENPLLKGSGIKTTAVLDGDEYVINGNKSWPTNGGLANVYLTICTTDPEAGEDGIALIMVPHDAKGLSFGQPEDKMLFKTSQNASIYYNNVRVPKEYRIAGSGMDAKLYYATTAGTQWHSAVMALGVAERAFDLVLKYTGERYGGFKPVRQHSIAAGIIADMAIGIEMMRASVYNLSYMMDHLDTYGPPWSPKFVSKTAATRVFAGDTAVNIINKGAELLGALAISKDFPYEKCLRDAKIFQLWLGGQQISRYRVAEGYYELKNWA